MTLADGQRQDLRHLIGMMVEDAPAQGLEQPAPRLDDELDFTAAFNLALPAIDGGEPRQLIDAGGEVPGQQLFADAICTGFIRAGA
ncbi:hypothetical protein D3C80_1567390 [compost metagenome]